MCEPKDTQIRLGQRIRELRIRQGYSLRELGEIAGVHFSQVQKIEKGNANPKLDTICLIADALGTSVVGLLDDRDSPRPEIMDVLALLREKPKIQVEKANEVLSIMFSEFVQYERKPYQQPSVTSQNGHQITWSDVGTDVPRKSRRVRAKPSIGTDVPLKFRRVRTKASDDKASKSGKAE